MAVKTYEDNGVLLSKKAISRGDKLKVIYNGILAQSGAECIYIHAGYGDDWTNSCFIRMEKAQDGFTADIEVQEGKNLGICFKDTADNWDNNSGENYNFKISGRSGKNEGTKNADDGVKKEKAVKSEKAVKLEKAVKPDSKITAGKEKTIAAAAKPKKKAADKKK